MSEQIHNTVPVAPKSEPLGELFRKYLPAATFAVLIIGANFIWNANNGQSHLAFQVEQIQKATEQNAANIKSNADTMNQFLIALTKMSEAQNRLAEDVKTLQQQNQRTLESRNR